jgi:hypothetical protein
VKDALRKPATALLLAALLPSCTGADAVPTIPSEPIGPTMSGEPRSETDNDGPFELTITSDQDRYRAGQVLGVRASLVYRGSSDTIAASGSGTLVGFGLDGPGIAIRPLFTADCERLEFRRDQAVDYAFVKSGTGVPPGDPAAGFYESYFSSRDLRLPAGTWTISAQSVVYEGGQCRGSGHELSASVTIEVEP